MRTVRGETVYGLHLARVPLCLECAGCGHRALYEAESLWNRYLTNEMTSLGLLVQWMRRDGCGVWALSGVEAPLK